MQNGDFEDTFIEEQRFEGEEGEIGADGEVMPDPDLECPECHADVAYTEVLANNEGMAVCPICWVPSEPEDWFEPVADAVSDGAADGITAKDFD